MCYLLDIVVCYKCKKLKKLKTNFWIFLVLIGIFMPLSRQAVCSSMTKISQMTYEPRKIIYTSPKALQSFLAIKDLTNPINGPHAISLMVERINQVLASHSNYPPIAFYRSGPIAKIVDEFDALYIPPEDKQRSAIYTRYVSSTEVLRTHTTTVLPKVLQEIKAKGVKDILAFCPGMCYRRDIIDKTRTGEPHKIDIWRIKKGELNKKALVDLIEMVLESISPNLEYRTHSTTHPYTVEGLKIDVRTGSGHWLRLMACGQASPRLFQDAGLNPQEYSGIGLGLGLDRLVMVIKQINDIRLLRSKHPLIKAQMTNLAPYIPITKTYKAFSRDFTTIMTNPFQEQDVCELIREIMGEDIRFIEKLSLSGNEGLEQLGVNPSRCENSSSITKVEVPFTITWSSNEQEITQEEVDKWSQHINNALNK